MATGGLKEFEVRIGDSPGRERPGPDDPFRILVFGDFGGVRPLARPWRPLRVDRDNFSEVMRKAQVVLRLGWNDAPELVLAMDALDDFHPDTLFERLPALGRLRSLRARIADPGQSLEAAREARALLGLPTDATPALVEPRSGSGAEWLADVLDEGESNAASRTPADPLEAVIRRLARQYSVVRPPADQQQLLALLDETAGGTLRAFMHHPRFQAVEAAWRGLKLLVDRLDTGSELQVLMLDVTRDELDADLGAGNAGSRARQIVAEPESGPWAVVAGLYGYGPAEPDATQLLRLAGIARSAGAPFLAAASAQVVGCDSLAATPDPEDWRLNAADESDPGRLAWSALRARSEAAWLGLALPRFLLRLPYGRKSDPCERFDFEEMPAAPAHEDYLWGHPAYACVLLLGQSFSRSGWAMAESMQHVLDGLPLHSYREDGESRVKPCAELALRERALDRLLDAGLLVLVSPRGEDRAVLARWQSITSPPTRLAGGWS